MFFGRKWTLRLDWRHCSCNVNGQSVAAGGPFAAPSRAAAGLLAEALYHPTTESSREEEREKKMTPNLKKKKRPLKRIQLRLLHFTCLPPYLLNAASSVRL